MSDLTTGQFIAISLGGVVLVMVLTGPFIMSRIFGSPKGSKSRELIPAAETFSLSAGEAMTVVRQILTDSPFLGCRYRITYDRMDEGRIQARLYGMPRGEGVESDDVAVDVLLNMLFHRLDSAKTEIEWSFVVMSRQTNNAMQIVSLCNQAFRSGLGSAQPNRQSMAEQMLASQQEEINPPSKTSLIGETFKESFDESPQSADTVNGDTPTSGEKSQES